jgi:hypothetical protein
MVRVKITSRRRGPTFDALLQITIFWAGSLAIDPGAPIPSIVTERLR